MDLCVYECLYLERKRDKRAIVSMEASVTRMVTKNELIHHLTGLKCNLIICNGTAVMDKILFVAIYL